MTPNNAHSDPITLPSAFNPKDQAKYGLNQLADIEMTLRIGQCHVDIHSLCRALGVRSHLTRHSHQASSYNLSTRMQETIRHASRDVASIAQMYCRHYNGLVRLRASKAASQALHGLEKSDLIMLSDWIEQRGFTTKQEITLPWIWTLLENQ